MDKKEIIEQVDMIFEKYEEAGMAIFTGGCITGVLSVALGIGVTAGIYSLYEHIAYSKARKEAQKRYEELEKNLF